jgi:hypothetical protein
VEVEVDVPYDGLRLRRLSEQLMKHLTRYFAGSGHLNLPGYNELISPDKLEEARQDLTLRARQFLSHMTGMSCLDSPPKEMEVRSLLICIHT